MAVYTVNKGFASWEVKVHGKAIHSSMALMSTSCNAIEYAAQIITKIREIALDLRRKADVGIDKDNAGSAQYDYPSFSTMTAGAIEGGDAVSMEPAGCRFICSVCVTGTAVAAEVESAVSAYVQESMLSAMRQEYSEASVELISTTNMPAFNASEDAKFTMNARALCGDDEIHKKGGGTETGFFHERLGIQTVIVDPGTVKVAHVANEYVQACMTGRCHDFLIGLGNLYTTTTVVGSGTVWELSFFLASASVS